jgi:hypothetical protein
MKLQDQNTYGISHHPLRAERSREPLLSYPGGEEEDALHKPFADITKTGNEVELESGRNYSLCLRCCHGSVAMRRTFPKPTFKSTKKKNQSPPYCRRTIRWRRERDRPAGRSWWGKMGLFLLRLLGRDEARKRTI